jgi:hypothetical protein
MGNSTEGITDHRVPNFRDQTDVLARLSPTVPVLMRVSDYYRSKNSVWNEIYPVWTLVEDYTYFAYCGPGGFSVMFGAHVAAITASSRYCAFALMPSLQAVELPAVRSIAQALGGTRLVLKSDDQSALQDSPIYLNDGNATLDECVGLIQKAWGNPRPNTEAINEAWEIYRERKIEPWFFETLDQGI